MTQQALLKCIADAGYNAGFGAKKHFASYDMISKVPGIINFLSIAVGVFALFVDCLSVKGLSATFIVMGVLGIYISKFDHKKQTYEDRGKELTKIFDELKVLYYEVKSSNATDVSTLEGRLAASIKNCHNIGLSEQILCSDWYAHYKFFWQHQIEWIDEQKNFKFFRDKMPLSFMVSIGAIVVGFIAIHFCCKSGAPLNLVH